MSTAVAVLGVLSALIAAIAAWITHREAGRASVKVADTQTRGQLEEQAFERAKGFYTDVIDRQDREIHDQAVELESLKARVATCEDQVDKLRRQSAYYRRAARTLARGVHQLRQALDPALATLDAELEETVLRVLSDDLET